MQIIFSSMLLKILLCIFMPMCLFIELVFGSLSFDSLAFKSILDCGLFRFLRLLKDTIWQFAKLR